MSEINIHVEGGAAKRLLTAGKCCDRDILVTAGEEQLEALLDGSITELHSNAPAVAGYACYRHTSLVKVDLPKATRSNLYGFEGCTKLEEVSMPEAISFGNKVFFGCTSLKKVYLPKAESLAIECFSDCTSLERIDLPAATSFSRDTFNGCSSLSTVILRASKMVSSVSGTFSGTPIVNGTGYIYVPRTLVDTYKANSKWSVYADQFRAIEDYPEITDQ